jgi:cytochrome P450
VPGRTVRRGVHGGGDARHGLVVVFLQERFDVARENARDHVSFSGGRHYCLGASLARMEGEVGLRALAERFLDMRLLPGARRRPTRILRGYESLPARLR